MVYFWEINQYSIFPSFLSVNILVSFCKSLTLRSVIICIMTVDTESNFFHKRWNPYGIGIISEEILKCTIIQIYKSKPCPWSLVLY